MSDYTPAEVAYVFARLTDAEIADAMAGQPIRAQVDMPSFAELSQAVMRVSELSRELGQLEILLGQAQQVSYLCFDGLRTGVSLSIIKETLEMQAERIGLALAKHSEGK